MSSAEGVFVPNNTNRQPSADDEESNEQDYTAKQQAADKRRGCTPQQINVIKRVLACDPHEWHDILDVGTLCTVEEAHQAYKKKSLAVHPDKNPSTKAKLAFQMVQDAAEGLEAGDDYKGADANQGPNTDRKKPSQPHPKPTTFQKEIYDEATEHMETLKSNPADKNAKKRLDELNERIKQQNKKDGKKDIDIQQGIIEYHTHIAMFKLVGDYEEAIRTVPTTDSEEKKQNFAKEKLPRIGPDLDKINVEKDYPRTWNILGFSPGQQSSMNPDLPQQTRAPNTTREGYAILGARQCGNRGHRFVVENGKSEVDDNPIEYRSGADLGFDIADAYLEGKKKEEWDITRANVSRKADAKNYKKIIGIASSPIRTTTVGNKPRYPESHIWTQFEEPTGNEYKRILSRSKLGEVIGALAADREIAGFYQRRPLLTPPWQINPIAITAGNPRAIDGASGPALTPAPAPGVFAATVSPATGVAGGAEQLLQKSDVEGLKSQLEDLFKLLRLAINSPANAPVTA